LKTLVPNQLKALEENAKEYGISHWDAKNGIVHVVVLKTELLPGATILWRLTHFYSRSWTIAGLVLLR
jgi:3-isopropylmalate/(R)-2-methylmalate dehydratase large subunit